MAGCIYDQSRPFGTQSASHESLVMEGETYLRLLGRRCIRLANATREFAYPDSRVRSLRLL